MSEKKDIVIITGAAGWMGEHAVRFAHDHFSAVLATDVQELSYTVIPSPTKGWFVRADFTDRDSFKKVVAEAFRLADEHPSARIHFWHNGGLFDYAAPEMLLLKVNYWGTQRVIEDLALPLHRSGRLGSFVYWSGATVYGDFNFRLPAMEDSPKHPINFYGWTKLLSEEYILQMCAQDPSFPAVIMQITGAYGPGIGKRKSYGMAKLLELFHRGSLQNFPLMGASHYTAALVHVKDIIRCAHFLGNCSEAHGQRYLVTDDGRYTNVGISKVLGSELENPYLPIPMPRIMLKGMISVVEATGKFLKLKPEVDSGLAKMMTINTWSSNRKLWELAERHGRGRLSSDPLLMYPDSAAGLSEAIRDLRREGWLQ